MVAPRSRREEARHRDCPRPEFQVRVLRRDPGPDHRARSLSGARPWRQTSVYNIRGLTSPGCNWHLGMYEADERGDYRGFDDAFIRIDERVFYPYAQAYDNRVLTPIKEELEQRMDPVNYWRRGLFLQKFDEREWSRHYPWQKRRRRMIVRTPEQFWNAFAASARLVVKERRSNPDFEIPEAFIRIVVLVKPIIDEVWPQIEERYRAPTERLRLAAERLAMRSRRCSSPSISSKRDRRTAGGGVARPPRSTARPQRVIARRNLLRGAPLRSRPRRSCGRRGIECLSANPSRENPAAPATCSAAPAIQPPAT